MLYCISSIIKWALSAGSNEKNSWLKNGIRRKNERNGNGKDSKWKTWDLEGKKKINEVAAKESILKRIWTNDLIKEIAWKILKRKRTLARTKSTWGSELVTRSWATKRVWKDEKVIYV